MKKIRTITSTKFDVLALDGKLAENFIQSEENPLRAVSTRGERIIRYSNIIRIVEAEY